MESSRPLSSLQPFKAIYIAYFLLKTPIHLLLLSIKYILKPLRPLPAWTLIENASSAAVGMFLDFCTATRSQRIPFMYTAPEKAGDRHERVAPAPAALLAGPLAASDVVRPEAVDTVWTPGLPPQDAAERARQRVVLHFPGGAFVLAFSHQYIGIPVLKTLNKHFRADRGVWAQYRLAGTPETRFPAALQDAVTFYHHVLSLGIKPENIIVSGDSAGGNVAIAFLRYLQSGHSNLPPPRGVAVFSPWVHVTATAGPDYDEQPYSRSDYLKSSLLQWGSDVYRPPGRLTSEIESYISPLHRPFELPSPLFIHAGAVEGFHDNVKSFAQEMSVMNGNRVLFRSTPLAPHDILSCHQMYGKTKELEDVLDEAFEFFEQAK